MSNRMIQLDVTPPLMRMEKEMQALRSRVGKLRAEIRDLRVQVEGQVYRLANRLAHLEAVTPAARVFDGT